MAKKTREELVLEFRKYGSMTDACERFYNLSHDGKADLKTFELFCKAHNGQIGLLLSDEVICDNKELVLIAKKYGLWGNYHLLSKRLLNDPEMAVVLAPCNANEYRNISKTLRDDSGLMLQAVRVNPHVFRSLPVSTMTNRAIVLEVAKTFPRDLECLFAVKKERWEPLRHDKEIALEIARKDPGALCHFCADELLHDKELLEEVFCISDKKECRKRLANHTWGFHFVDSEIWIEDRTLIKKALRCDGQLFEILPIKYRDDMELALLAIRDYPYAIEYCSETLRDDETVVKAALQQDTEEILSYVSMRLRANYDVVYKAVGVDALNLQYASEELRDNKEIVIRALKVYGGVLEDASERLRNDEYLIKLSQRNM